MAMLCLSISASAYDFEVDGLYYDLSSLSNRTCKLTSGGTAYTGALIIPESVNYEGLIFKVTEIDTKAFNANITELSIPATVTTIPSSTIKKCKLTRLTFQDGESPLKVNDYVEKSSSIYGPTYGQPLQYLYIGRTLTNHGSFSHSSSLTEIIIGPYVTDMPYLYGSNKLESVYIPDNVINLKGDGLGNCLGLRTVFVGNGVSKIANEFFIGSTSLENVYLGNNVSEIGWAAFNNCKKLTNLYIFSDKLTTIAGNTSDGIDYCLPKTISKIYVSNPSRYDNLLNGYHRENLITLNNSSIEYSGKLPDFSYKNNVIGASISFPSSDLNYSVGTYNLPIPVIFTFDNGWSTSSNVAASYTINPASLTIIANDASRKYGTENPKLICSFFGFKNGETEEVLTRMPSVETTATRESNVGTYPIIPSGAEAQNYTFNYERGTLTITKADQAIEWEQHFGTVNVGDVVELTATSSTDLPVKYTSTDESIAEIFTQGGKKYVEFLKPGNVSLRATQEGNENYNEADRVSKSVKVDLLVSSITLNQSAATLSVGNSLQLTASVAPANASNKTLIWESANTDIATVDDNGKVNALKQGSTIITVRSTDGSNISAQCELTVVELVAGISINITTATLVEGQSLQLEAIVSPESATNKSVEWSSSNEAVAAVSEDGKITAISKGSAVITAKSTDGSNVSASCHVNVIKLVSGIVLSDIEITLNEGQSTTLTAIVTPETANNKNLTWESSDTAVATVTEDGKVTAISKGSAVITAKSTDGSHISASCTVNVVKLVSGIVLSETEMTLNEGSTAQLTAIVSADANNPMITWMSSNESVATVNQDGKVSAIAKGTAIITAKTTDGSNISASCTVNVVKLVNGIILSETDITLNEGETVTITATVTPDLANNKAIVWTSSNESIATVDEYGVITAHLQGKAIITAKSTDGSNISASCAITVVKLVTAIYISDTMVDMKIGEQTTITAYAIPSNATNTRLRWYSEDENIATVEDGVVTAVGIGTTYICVESTDGSNIVEKCKIEVGDSSGIGTIATEAISVYVVNGIINIANVPSNQTVRIFHTNGTLIKSELSTGNLMTFQPSANGIYIVVVGTNSYKVVIR